ncbi:hypothetical protein JCM8547_000043 [Rhodosporidiobolus lusitaniae]
MSESSTASDSVEQVEFFIAAEEHEREGVKVQTVALDSRVSSGSCGAEPFSRKSTLPNELLDQVLAGLNKPHLYRKLEISIEDYELDTDLRTYCIARFGRMNTLMHLLPTRHDLAKLVREVDIAMWFDAEDVPFDFEFGSSDIESTIGNDEADEREKQLSLQWLKMQEVNFGFFLSFLPNLSTLSIVYSTDCRDWDSQVEIAWT